ncbi:hypothetical protein QN400_05940 [Pseudomonas sp. RTC3]|uniref:hypothetical protein n=1 Tax=unclassified Pseudomonas TaxID=196821 RepID=UPI002AB536F5|nr:MULTISPECIES: hypothetical protein [unclassified Pseudomonas]MEB0061561.1 hypothetical protein [Pseudomonas sp. RTC3]MDY7566664.1 hypothetical protein [Pseudomonas sp. 5C2]MEB0027394.1 hypothetical protein [Pseudomonas sp. MH9.2]MEB0148707.1 hypothetical protein [Pseudomonas sp. CCC2.2]MEB0240637.1 hypothetical protein [Pseudomonas sp. 5C2]
MFSQLSRMADERLIEMLSVEKDEFLASAGMGGMMKMMDQQSSLMAMPMAKG